jgi:hypothetical protein
MASKDRRYGIRITLPPQDPLASPHLLGRNWESFRWYADPATRDRAMREMLKEHPYSRRGDLPSIVCEPVDR